MAIAFKCDRCGKFFEPDSDEQIKQVHTFSRYIDISKVLDIPKLLNKMDLCDTCYSELDMFLKGK